MSKLIVALEIKKITRDGVEFLPSIEDTSLWAFYNPESNCHSNKSERQLVGLYNAIRDRENYFQEHTPTPFGSPTYNTYSGIVCGFLQAMEAWESEESGQIIIRKSRSNRKLLVIDKVTLPASYHESRREISETLAAFGL